MENIIKPRIVGTILVGFGATILGGIGVGLVVAGVLVLIPCFVYYMDNGF